MNVFEELSPLFSELVSLTIADAPETWMRLWIRTECEEGAWSVGGYWELNNTDEVIFFEVPSEACDLIYEAWKVSRSNKNSWSTALFKVDRPNKLTISFGYEDLDDEAYSPDESEDRFRLEVFGNRPIRSTIDMSGAFTLTPELLSTGLLDQPHQ